MKKNSNVKVTRLFYGNDVPVLQEVEAKYYGLSYRELLELANKFMNDTEKENLQTIANQFCKIDCEGSFENMTEELKIMHYLHSNYRTQIIIDMEQRFEKENNIIVKVHPSVEARKSVARFMKTLEYV